MEVAALDAVVAHRSQAASGRVVGRQDRTCVSPRSEVLAGIEAGGGDVTEGHRRATEPPRTLGLGGVFDDDDARADDRADLFDRRCLAVEVHRDDGRGPRADGSGDGVGIEQQVVLLAVGKHDGRAGAHDGLGGGHERVGREDDLVAWPDAGGPEGQLDGVGAVADADGVVGAAEGGQVALEALDLCTKHEVAPVDDPADHGKDLRPQRFMLATEVDERDGVDLDDLL